LIEEPGKSHGLVDFGVLSGYGGGKCGLLHLCRGPELIAFTDNFVRLPFSRRCDAFVLGCLNLADTHASRTENSRCSRKPVLMIKFPHQKGPFTTPLITNTPPDLTDSKPSPSPTISIIKSSLSLSRPRFITIHPYLHQPSWHPPRPRKMPPPPPTTTTPNSRQLNHRH
jgi:hypothetical protein